MSGLAWGALAALARNEARRSWRGLVAVGVAFGLAAAVVVGGLAVARRSATAHDRLEVASGTEDVRVDAFAGRETLDAVAELPHVRQAWTAGVAVGRLVGPEVVYLSVRTGPAPPDGLATPVVVRGRPARPERAEEVVLIEAVAEELGVEPGDRLQLQFLLPEEVAQFDTGFGEPDGPDVDLVVTGVARTGALPTAAPVLAGPAFDAVHGDDVRAGDVLHARLHGGVAAVPAFHAAVDRLGDELVPDAAAAEFGVFSVASPLDVRAEVDATTRVLVGGLLVVVVVGAAAALLALAQALARRHALGAADQRIEATLGLTAAERTLARAVPALLAAGVAALVVVAGGLVAGLVEPLGALRRYEPAPGWAPDLVVTAAGATATAAAVVAISAWAAWRAGRPRPVRQPGRAARGAAPAAAGSSAVVRAGLALALGRSRASTSVRSAVVAAVLGVAGVVAATTFGASLARLGATPARYGWPGDLAVVDATPEHLDRLAADPDVAGLAVFESSTGRLDGLDASVYAVAPRRGELGWTVLTGRAPGTDDEIVLGSRLAEELGAEVGDTVVATADGTATELQVVGTGIGPPLDGEPLGSSALVTRTSLDEVGRTQRWVNAVVRVAPGVDADAMADRLAADVELARAAPPGEVRNLLELWRLPDLLGAFLAVVAAFAVAHALVVTGRRRVRDLAVLRVLGFTPAQAGGAVAVTAGTIAAVGLLAGVPLGLGVARLVWWAVADATGVATDVALPSGVLAALAPATLAGAVVLAARPARWAARLRPAAALRAE